MNLGEIADIRSGLVLSRKQARADSPQAIRYHQLSLRAVKAEGEIDPLNWSRTLRKNHCPWTI